MGKLNQDIVWESNDVELLGVTIDNNLRFDKHVSNICLKANRKLSALTRVAKFVPLKKRHNLFKEFIELKFKYCSLIWMFHVRQINDKINKLLHERDLRIAYNDTVSSFENLLIKDKFFTIHHQNIQSLTIEIYKAIHNLPGGKLSELFVRNNHNYNLRSESELLLPNVNTVFKGQNSISYFGSVIWNSIPSELRKTSSYQIFRSEIKRWRPTNCPCRLCKNYIGNLGFINTSS